MISGDMIAPCGMNCAICLGHLREKNKCPGCNSRKKGRVNHCLNCGIRNCSLKKKKSEFCFKCEKFPCVRIKNLDKRYRTKYNMSMIDNLNYIKKNGLESFTKQQGRKYKCRHCGGLVCVHRDKCLACEK